MKVSLGERERVRKNLNPQRGRERERVPLLLALTLFAKVQSSGTTDRKVKINHRSAPNFLLLFRRRRRRKRFEFRFAAAAGADPKFPTRFEVGRIDRRASETPILNIFPPKLTHAGDGYSFNPAAKVCIGKSAGINPQRTLRFHADGCWLLALRKKESEKAKTAK